jgi:hypothetical protein
MEIYGIKDKAVSIESHRDQVQVCYKGKSVHISLKRKTGPDNCELHCRQGYLPPQGQSILNTHIRECIQAKVDSLRAQEDRRSNMRWRRKI